jgi:hypothetical protein
MPQALHPHGNLTRVSPISARNTKGFAMSDLAFLGLGLVLLGLVALYAKALTRA